MREENVRKIVQSMCFLWLCVYICECVCVWLLFWKWKSKESCTCSFYQPVESSFQHSFNYSLCSSAWLRQASLHTADQILSHIAAFLCHRVAWSLITHSATLHRSPISYSKGETVEPPLHTPPTLPPLLVGCPAFIDHKSTSLAALIVNQPQWHYWSGQSLSYMPALSLWSTLRLWHIDPAQIQYWSLFIDNSFIVL